MKIAEIGVQSECLGLRLATTDISRSRPTSSALARLRILVQGHICVFLFAAWDWDT